MEGTQSQVEYWKVVDIDELSKDPKNIIIRLS